MNADSLKLGLVRRSTKFDAYSIFKITMLINQITEAIIIDKVIKLQRKPIVLYFYTTSRNNKNQNFIRYGTNIWAIT